MSTEELLKPRYKVIADYPDNPFSENEILVIEDWMVGYYSNIHGERLVRLSDIEHCPHIFKKLEEEWAAMPNKTGVDLIAEERQEQIEKHGFDVHMDKKFYKHYELIQAALFCIDQTIEVGYGLKTSIGWPDKWDEIFEHKIKSKDTIGKLKVAGALIAAEIDRLNIKK